MTSRPTCPDNNSVFIEVEVAVKLHYREFTRFGSR